MSSEYLKQRLAELQASPARAPYVTRKPKVKARAEQLRRRAAAETLDMVPPEACEMCGGTNKDPGKRLALDHCHTTGKLRGWLCHKCNLGLGLLGDCAESLRRAVAYLAKYDELRPRGFGIPSGKSNTALYSAGEGPNATPSPRLASMLAAVAELADT